MSERTIFTYVNCETRNSIVIITVCYHIYNNKNNKIEKIVNSSAGPENNFEEAFNGIIRGLYTCVRFPFDKDTRSYWEVARHATFTFTEITRTHIRRFFRYVFVYTPLHGDKYKNDPSQACICSSVCANTFPLDPLSFFEALFLSSPLTILRFLFSYFFSAREIRLRPELFEPLTKP